MLLNDSADEIRNLLEATIEGDKSPIFVRARRCTRLAGVYLSRFQQAIEQAVHDGRLDESQNLLVLRMRLLRDYSGTWLLADKPLLAR